MRYLVGTPKGRFGEVIPRSLGKKCARSMSAPDPTGSSLCCAANAGCSKSAACAAGGRSAWASFDDNRTGDQLMLLGAAKDVAELGSSLRSVPDEELAAHDRKKLRQGFAARADLLR